MSWPTPEELWGADWKERTETSSAQHRTPPLPPRPLRTLRSLELAFTPPPPPEFCVEGLFACPSLNLLVGDPGSKKSLLAIDLSLCVALGLPWLDHHVTQKPVLFIDEESGLFRLLQRLNSAASAHHASKETPFHFICDGDFDFRLPADTAELTQHALSTNAGLIVIDALADVMRGGDENSVISIQPVLYNLRRVARDCNAAVLVIHHNNKQGAFRGSTAISAAVDHLLAIQSPSGDSLIRLRTVKARDLPGVELFARAHIEPDLFWLSVTEDQPAPEPAAGLTASARRVLEFLADHRRATTTVIMRQIHISTPAAIRKIIYELMAAGFINRVDGGNRGQIATYELSDNGKRKVRQTNLKSE